MKITSVLAYFCVASVLSGCATPANTYSPTPRTYAPSRPQLNIYNASEVAAAVDIERDDFKKMTKFTGPEIQDGSATRKFLIRAWKYESPPVLRYQIYMTNIYLGKTWNFYSLAYDRDGKIFELTSIKREPSCRTGLSDCLFTEIVGVSVDRAYLEKYMSSGMEFKISGRGGDAVFSMPGPYVEGILKAIPDFPPPPPRPVTNPRQSPSRPPAR